MTKNPLHALMSPASIAIAGAGNNFMKMGTMHALSILKDGFAGKLYPVHPREKSVLGIEAYPTVADLPEAPDLAFLVVPASQVLGLMEEFGARGTRRAVIITAGFGETGTEGRAMQERLLEISREHGIRFLGPNCMGIINTAISLNTTVMPYTFGEGSLGFASQSGTYVTQSIPYLAKHGIRFSKAISVGNSANIDIIDALEYMGEDEKTGAVSLYIEGLKDVPRFIEVARKITPRKPVLAQYVGGSGAGARSSMSHTGSMAAPDHLYDGLFRQAGIIRAGSVEELYHYGNMLALQPPLRGRRIGVVTNSGGPGSAMANVLEQGGCEVPEFSPELQEKLRPLMPPHAPCGNPVDLTFSMDIEVLSVKIPELVMGSGEVDGITMHGVMRSGFLVAAYDHVSGFLGGAPVEKLLESLPDNSVKNVNTLKKAALPVAVSSFYGRDDDYTGAYQDGGIPVFDSPEKTAGAMLALLRHLEVRERTPWSPPAVPAPPVEAERILAACRERGRGNLDEYESKLFLKAWGLPVPDEILAATEEEAAEVARRMNAPLALKACAADILHKSGKGLIHLNVKSVDEAVEAFGNIRRAAGRDVAVLMGPMVRGDREFVAGAVRPAGFVASVMFGLGGIFTEALGDALFRPAPLSKADAAEMIGQIRARKLLGAFRGMPPVRVDLLARALHILSLIPLAHPGVSEIDINPIIIDQDMPVIVDALVILDSAG